MSDSAQVTYAIPISVQTTASLNISMKDALKGIKNDSSLESVNWLNTHAQSSTAQQISMYSFFSINGKAVAQHRLPLPLQRKTSFIMPNILILQRYRPRLKKTIRPKPKKPYDTGKESETYGSSYRLYLGNNGRLDLSLDHSVTISKTVLSRTITPLPIRYLLTKPH